ncbi:hypothetical protein N836_00685 [Leptolyngbya sp. Heron Island J]|uniref:hypothetical protein n=1 Tax=Leptolyngbya sp. Heron Island J TaxID=1385935 RepID=UPI0003B93D01|nr:hypothetical protein [Leptolyngbya sp. Heron Island J]ESA36423.1 hypothetical protein N836_00685 [Leptolyngbya sp. Heron Island J]
MVKKLILICLVGLLGIVSFIGPAGANALSSTTVHTTVWNTQMETPTQTVPSEQPRPKKQPEAAPTTDQTPPKQTTDQQQSPPVRKQSKPFNPYDMKALERFDAGDHRAQ